MPQSREEGILRNTFTLLHFLPKIDFPLINNLQFLASLPLKCYIPNLVKIDSVVLENKMLTDDGRHTTHDDGRQPISEWLRWPKTWSNFGKFYVGRRWYQAFSTGIWWLRKDTLPDSGITAQHTLDLVNRDKIIVLGGAFKNCPDIWRGTHPSLLITQASEGPPNYAPSTASKGYLKGSPVWNKSITASSLSLINLKKCTIAFRSYVEMWLLLP